VVDRALARNPIAARAEYWAEFRSDLEGYVSLDTLRACTGPLAEWQPLPGIKYTAGIDAAMGSGEDSLALAVSRHDEASDKVILDQEQSRREIAAFRRPDGRLRARQRRQHPSARERNRQPEPR
jgi:hypothetical protein